MRHFLKVLLAFLFGASHSEAADKEKIIAKDDQYVSYENGIVCDEKANSNEES